MLAKILISDSDSEKNSKIAELLILNGLKNPHPDLLSFSNDAKLGIAEARKIRDFFSIKPYSGKGRGVVLENASALTPDAQNALLKTIEELPASALLILCAKSDAGFLPTVLSRCEILRVKSQELRVKNEYQQDIERLLQSNTSERFEYIEKLKEREEFFKALVKYFHKNLPDNPEFVKELLIMEELANQNVNIRAILEYLMLRMHTK